MSGGPLQSVQSVAAGPVESRVHDRSSASAVDLDRFPVHDHHRAISAPDTSITGAQSSQTERGALDWLEVSCAVRWNSDFAEKWGRLLTLQAERRLGLDGAWRLDSGVELQVEPHGSRHGLVHCPIVVRSRSVRMAMSADQVPHETTCNVFIRITGEGCLAYGAEWLWSCTTALIRSLGGEIVRETVSRVDLCIDRPDEAVDDYVAAWAADKFVARFERSAVHKFEREFSGTHFGIGGQVQCRIYDKVLETREKPERRAMMIHRRWGHECDHATRVEFQIGRDTLREKWAVNTAAELFAALGIIAEWCCTSWLRLTDEKPDRENKHQGRIGPSELWQSVTQQFAEAFTSRVVGELPAVPAPCPVKLWRQSLGCITSALARSYETIESTAQLYAVLADVVSAQVEQLLETIDRKKRLFALRTSYAALDPIDIPY